jgi:hypothetical protein
MIWVLVAALGSVAWLSVVLFFLALCHAAGRADDRGQAMAPRDAPLGLAGPAAVLWRSGRELPRHARMGAGFGPDSGQNRAIEPVPARRVGSLARARQLSM